MKFLVQYATFVRYAAALVGREAVIDSFEPGKQVVTRQRENLALNKLDNVRVHEGAVLDRR